MEKFKELWKNGHGAHLDIDCYAGQASVGLRVRLGQVPGPLHHQDDFYQQKRTKDSPCRQRRRAKRAAARQQNEAVRDANYDGQNKETIVADKATEVLCEAAVAVEETAIAAEIVNEADETEEVIIENQKPVPVAEKVVDVTTAEEVIHEDVIDVVDAVDVNDTEKDARENEINSNEVEETEENFDKNNVDATEKEGENREEDNSCDQCDFVGKTPAGLKTHRTTKHRYLFRRFSR